MFEEKFYESQQRINWFIDGYYIHGLSSRLFSNLSTGRIVEVYNVEMEYFKLKK